MKLITNTAELPNTPAVYAMYGGRDRYLHVAYVGIADKLKQRITQHLVRRDSSVTTGTSVVSLNPDLVTQLLWWEHPGFAERGFLEAAELVAFDLLEPALRSRGGITARAQELLADPAFMDEMKRFFQGEPSGRMVVLTLQDALKRIEDLERQVAELRKLLTERP